jgi:hydantoinase/carbamoylase family amidase
MEQRHDALAAASEFVLEVERQARGRPGLVATVGQLQVEPGAVNVIPGQVDLSLDVRHADDATRAGAAEQILERANAIANRRKLAVAVELISENVSVPCSPRLVSLLSQAVAGLGHEVVELPSGAGHDAVSMSSITEVAMLFVRCKGGVSHNPAESVTSEDVGVAIDVLSKFLELVR